MWFIISVITSIKQHNPNWWRGGEKLPSWFNWHFYLCKTNMQEFILVLSFHIFHIIISCLKQISRIWYVGLCLVCIFVNMYSVSSRFAVTPCVISSIAKLRYRFWKEPNRTTRISTVAKWEIWFRENHGDFTGSSPRVLLHRAPIRTLPIQHIIPADTT